MGIQKKRTPRKGKNHSKGSQVGVCLPGAFVESGGTVGDKDREVIGMDVVARSCWLL